MPKSLMPAALPRNASGNISRGIMPKLSRELYVTYGCIAFAVVMTGLTFAELVVRATPVTRLHPGGLVEAVAFGLIVALLAYGGLVYQMARAGHFRRLLTSRDGAVPAIRTAQREGPARPLAVLVPSYREELEVIRQTVVSAALMEYPNRRITVLIDDPPFGDPGQRAALQATCKAIRDLHTQFERLAQPFEDAYGRFRRRMLGAIDARLETARVADLYRLAGHLIERNAATWTGRGPKSHADGFFAEAILARLVMEHRQTAQAFEGEELAASEIDREYRRLESLFRVPIDSFERKRYANLSHQRNKAMNLNAYIGLIGGAYREVVTAEGVVLQSCAPGAADVVAPAADYLLTLDADSVVLPDYAVKLVEAMEADERVAVAQTPYSAFPGAPGMLERVAGATTDLQYLAHQGSSAFGAAYWVGANALLRHSALIDIRTDTVERGHIVPIFIQDRTVIEDTGSTIDLIRRGWRLHNHPERLAYSATPPDFGSLAIQRRRWSNGGLIILPDLLRHLLSRRHGGSAGEGPMRIHYLVSPAVANGGLLALLAIPFDAHLASIWLPLSAAPYYFLYGRDLKQTGYRWSDLARIYALNLMLLPVNLAGVFDSARQILTGRKAPFARTPKIEGRTATPVGYLAFQGLAIVYLLASLARDILGGVWQHAVFSGLNLALFAYGFARFIGVREALADIRLIAASRRAPILADPAPERELPAACEPSMPRRSARAAASADA